MARALARTPPGFGAWVVSWRLRSPVAVLTLLAAAVLLGVLAPAAPVVALVVPAGGLLLGISAAGWPLFSVLALLGVWGADRLALGDGLLSFADALLIAGCLAPLLRLCMGAGAQVWRSLGHALIPVAVFQSLLLLAVIHRPTMAAAGEWGHRLIILAGGLLIGAYLIRCNRFRTAMGLLLALTIVMAGVAIGDATLHHLQPAYPLGINKNYAGGVFAGVALLVLAAPERHLPIGRLRLPLFVVVVSGLLATQSRGALVSLGVAIVVLELFRRRVDARALLAAGTAALTIGVSAVSIGAQIDQTSQSGSAFSSITQRQVYQAGALDAFGDSPILGSGIRFFIRGGYGLQGDPHDVIVLMLAESGVVGLAAFAFLLGGTSFGLVSCGGDLAPVALAIVAMRFTNGLFDVYWQHGPLALSWIVVGAALAVATQERERDIGREPATGDCA
jgi:O-antigen ligase